MELTKEDEEYLAGKRGAAIQKAMEILVGLGECYDAERMVPVTSVHLTGSSTTGAGKAGTLFFREMDEKGGKFLPVTHTNPMSIDPLHWKEIGISEETYQEQILLTDALVSMGAYICGSCTPYQVGHVPRLGEHVAWGESSATIFANSVLGARTNREGGASGLAAALAGRTPEYGLHLNQNRYGDLEIQVTAKLHNPHEYGSLGYFIGKVSRDRIPVITGLPHSISWDHLKLLGAAAATSGSVALFHIVGVTPEAPTREAAFGSTVKRDLFVFGEEELSQTEAEISKADSKEIDFIVIGCPFFSIGEFRQIAQLLDGKRIRSDVEFWILSCRTTRAYAQKMGYLETIEQSGAKVICEVCPSSLPRGLLKMRGHKTAATNSAKMAYYMAGSQSVLSNYGSIERCVEAGISGFWR